MKFEHFDWSKGSARLADRFRANHSTEDAHTILKLHADVIM